MSDLCKTLRRGYASGHIRCLAADRIEQQQAEIERLKKLLDAEMDSNHDLTARELEYAAENAKLQAVVEEGVRRVRLLLEIQEIVDNGPITERATRRWMAEALAALETDDD